MNLRKPPPPFSSSPVSNVRTMLDLPEALGTLLIASILIAAFSNLFGGYLDAIAILVIMAICILRDGKLRLAPPMLIPIALSAAYGVIWQLACSPVTCSPPVLSTGRSVFLFSVYLTFFAIFNRHEIVKVNSRVVITSFIFFFLFLQATNQFTILQSLQGMSANTFHNSYRFGFDNEINNINFTGLFCATLVPFAFPGRPKDFLGYLALSFIALVVIATYSRSSLAIFSILLLASSIVIWRIRFSRSLLIVAIFILGYLALSSFGYFERRAFDFEADRSIVARLRVFDMLSEVEFFGDKALLSMYFLRESAIDNTLVRHIVGAGALTILLFISVGPAVWRSLKQWSKGALKQREALALFGWVSAVLADDTFFSLWGAFLVGAFIMPTTIHHLSRAKEWPASAGRIVKAPKDVIK